jgi:hypothetical protein
MKHLALILYINGHVVEAVPEGRFASARECIAYVAHELTILYEGGLPIYGRVECKRAP